MNHNDNILLLHSTYVKTTGIVIPLLPVIERWLYEASVLGLEPEGFEMMLKARKKAVDAGWRHRPCLLLPHMFRDDEAIAVTLCEIAALRAARRLKTYLPDKSAVLQATGRPALPEGVKERHISEVIKAAGL